MEYQHQNLIYMPGRPYPVKVTVSVNAAKFRIEQVTLLGSTEIISQGHRDDGPFMWAIFRPVLRQGASLEEIYAYSLNLGYTVICYPETGKCHLKDKRCQFVNREGWIARIKDYQVYPVIQWHLQQDAPGYVVELPDGGLYCLPAKVDEARRVLGRNGEGCEYNKDVHNLAHIMDRVKPDLIYGTRPV